jgi:FixJ family two-component response regulator
VERSCVPVILSPREQETLRWIAEGLPQQQVATRMGVAPTTVDTYLKRVRSQTGPAPARALEQGRDLQRAGLVLDEHGGGEGAP